MRLKTFIILIFIWAVGYRPAWGEIASTQTVKVNINADYISYDNIASVVTATGNVRILYKDVKLDADSITYERSKGTIKGTGNIVFKSDSYSLKSEKISYNIFSSSGRVYTTKIVADPLFVYADEVQIRSSTVFFIPRGEVTTCDHYPPHYKFTGKNILIDTKSKFRIFNMLLFIRGIPSLYSPYYFKSLGPEKIEFDIDLGESTREGYFVKTRLSYPFTENSKTYMGVDYMTIMGIGLKAGHSYSASGGELDLDWYYVNEPQSSSTEEEIHSRKHNLSLDGWQQITQNLRIRGKAEYTDDRRFNYQYDREEGFEYFQQDLDTKAELEYSKSVYYASLFMDKSESWDVDKYLLNRYILPGVKLRIFPVGLPFNFSISGDSQYQNRYMNVRENWQPYFDWKTRLVTSHRLNIVRPYYITLTPGVGYSGDYVRYSTSDDTLTHYMSLFTGLRQGVYDKLFLDSDYHWKREVEEPYRITVNLLKQKATYRPFRQLKIDTQSSYDFRENIERPVGDFLSNLNLRVKDYSLFVRNRYDYYEEHTKDWLFELRFKKNFNSTLKYNYLYPLRLEIDAGILFELGKFEINPGVKFYTEKSSLQSWDYSLESFIEKNLTIKWDMHCWESSLQLRNRGEEYEFWLLFNISAFPETKSGLYGDIKTDLTGDIIETDYRFHRE